MVLLWAATLVFLIGAIGAYENRDTMRVLYAGVGLALLGILLTFSWVSFLAAAVTGAVHFFAIGHRLEQKEAEIEELASDAREGDISRDEIPDLLNALEDPDSEMRTKARSALIDIADEYRSAVISSILSGSVSDLDEDAADAYFGVVRGTFRACSADYIAPLLDEIEAAAEDEEERYFYLGMAVEGIAGRATDEEGRQRAVAVADRLVELLSLPEEPSPSDALLIYNAACEALAAVAREDPSRVRPAVDQLFAFVEEYDEKRAREMLDWGDGAPDEDVGVVAHEDAAAALAEVAGAYPEEMAEHAGRFREWLGDDQLRGGAVRALGGLAATHPDEVRPVESRLERILQEDDQPMVRIEAARTLAALGVTDGPTSELRELLRSRDPTASVAGDFVAGPRASAEEVRTGAVMSAAFTDIEDDIRAMVTGEEVEEPSGEETQRQVQEAFGTFVKLEAARTLFEIAADESDRRGALDTLIDICGGDAFQPRAASCLRDFADGSPDVVRDRADRLAGVLDQEQYVPPEVRTRVCDVLGEVCVTVPHQLRTLADDSAAAEGERDAAADAIDRIENRSRDEIAGQHDASGTDDGSTRGTAAGEEAGETAAAASTGDGEASGGAGRETDEEPSATVDDAERAGTGAETAETRPAEETDAGSLLDRLETGDPTERREAADKLATVAEADPDTVEPHAETLADLLEDEEESTVREGIVTVLGHLDTDAARETLRDARRDPDPGVSQRAMDLLD